MSCATLHGERHVALLRLASVSERDYFGNIIFPNIIDGKPVYKAGRGGL
jgi:hypothetical protein